MSVEPSLWRRLRLLWRMKWHWWHGGAAHWEAEWLEPDAPDALDLDAAHAAGLGFSDLDAYRALTTRPCFGDPIECRVIGSLTPLYLPGAARHNPFIEALYRERARERELQERLALLKRQHVEALSAMNQAWPLGHSPDATKGE